MYRGNNSLAAFQFYSNRDEAEFSLFAVLLIPSRYNTTIQARLSNHLANLRPIVEFISC